MHCSCARSRNRALQLPNKTISPLFRSLLGFRKRVDIKRMLSGGALILDVRTPAEFREGHAAGAMNIPLEALPVELKHLDKRKPIVTCCRSGARSASATALLLRNGFMAHNGGTWQHIDNQRPGS